MSGSTGLVTLQRDPLLDSSLSNVREDVSAFFIGLAALLCQLNWLV